MLKGLSVSIQIRFHSWEKIAFIREVGKYLGIRRKDFDLYVLCGNVRVTTFEWYRRR